MQRSGRNISGIVITFIILVNPLLLVSSQTVFNDQIYLNKVAECTFQVGYRIDIEDNIAYVSDNKGVQIIDIENPIKPKKIGRITLDDGAFGLEVKNKTAYIAANNLGLVIANVSNPEQPEIIGQLARNESANCLTISGNYCYLGLMNGNSEIINITDKTNPTFVNQIPYGSVCVEIAINDDLLFYVDIFGGIWIFNITEPENPEYIALYTFRGANTIAIRENILFIGVNSVIFVCNITEPENEQWISYTHYDDGEVLGLVFIGNLLGVADKSGVEVYNISNPKLLIEETENRQRIFAAQDIGAVGNFLFIAKEWGLGVFEISNTKRAYFPPYLYYVLPIVIIVMGGLSLLITRRRRKIISKDK